MIKRKTFKLIEDTLELVYEDVCELDGAIKWFKDYQAVDLTKDLKNIIAMDNS